MTVQVTSLKNFAQTLTSVPGEPFVLGPFKTARFEINTIPAEILNLDRLRFVQAELDLSTPGTIRSVRIAPGASTAGEAAGTSLINPATGLVYGQADGSGGFQELVSSIKTVDSASRNITASDNGKFLAPLIALTYTIPAGLLPMPSFTVDCPASGVISIARSTSATINGAGITLTRARASNPVGFVVLAHEADAYGVSGA